MPLTLHSIRPCLEGAVPAVIATCARDGTPNVSYISEVHYVDPCHVALSYQFFSKTRQNVLENPRATVIVIHPDTGVQYKLGVTYLRTEDSGPLFERMKAKLAGIASHAGMTGVFRLRGADVYRVESVTEIDSPGLAMAAPTATSLAELRCAMTRLSGASHLAGLLDALLDSLREVFGIEHSMVLMRDPAGDHLYTVASRGYPESGVGAEIRPGEGVIGTAALARTPIRISHATSEFGYGRAMREDATSRGRAAARRAVRGERRDQPLRLRRGRRARGAGGPRGRRRRPARGRRGMRGRGSGPASPGNDAARRAGAHPALRRERQHLRGRELPDQGRGRRDPLEAGARLRGRRAHRAHQPRAQARSRDPPAGPEREPRGA
ncbi:MAG: pyridoxamine 5'-phosphate oxidase family protein [Steroidobacteraceae bacterium]